MDLSGFAPRFRKVPTVLTKTALLTIDDSASIHMGERVDFLASKGVPAVWFCRGDYLAERPEPAIQALKNGSILGNHSWDHAFFSQLSLTEAFDQVDRTDRLIEELQLRAGVVRKVKAFRFPFEPQIGSPEHANALQKGLLERGFVPLQVEGVVSAAFLSQSESGNLSWFWTYDTEDWSLVGPDSPEAPQRLEAVLARMDKDDPEAACGLNRPGTEIVVMHDHGHTGAQWQKVVEGLLSKGLRFTLPLC